MGAVVDSADTSELRHLFERGRALGAQDSIAEALWLAQASQGAMEDAHDLLKEYISQWRRELSAADWSLRSVTRADRFWLQSTIP